MSNGNMQDMQCLIKSRHGIKHFCQTIFMYLWIHLIRIPAAHYPGMKFNGPIRTVSAWLFTSEDYIRGRFQSYGNIFMEPYKDV